MKISKFFTAAVMSLILSLQPMSVQAAMTDCPAYQYVAEKKLYTTTVQTPDSRKDWIISMGTYDPGVCPTTPSSYYIGEDGRISLSEEEFQTLSEKQEQTDAWIAANIQTIVPEGTPAAQVMQTAAEWETAAISYDNTAEGNHDACRNYQSAISGLTTGQGICTTYALIFNSVVSAVPISPETGLADYSCENPWYLQTRFVYNSEHAWSAVNIGGEWRFYDVTFYDSTGNSKYLNFGLMDDLNHLIYYPFF